MSTALDLIQGAFRKIGQYAPNETLAASDANDGLLMLNALLDIWSNEHLAVYNNVENIFTLTPGKLSYTIGTGGDVNITRPLRITNMYSRYVTSNSAVDFACQEISGDKYTALSLKSQPGPWPKFAYYNTGYPLATLLFWPLPTQGVEFHMWTDQLLANLGLTDSLQLPPGYFLALQYALAEMMAPEFGTDPATMTAVSVMAKKLRHVLKSTNAKPQSEVPLDAAGLSNGTVFDAGWILHGGFQ